MSIAERIVTLLERQGKRQSDLARFLRVRPTTVSEWVHGKREPSGAHYERVADFFGVSIDYLVTGREAPAAVQQIIGNDNKNNVVHISNGKVSDLSEFERELLNVSKNLDMRHKNALLSYAYELEKAIKAKN